MRRLYNWVLGWADTPYGTVALFLLAFSESSFFPVPPDILLIALSIAAPKRAFRYAFFCSVASVAGGCFGYLLGYAFMGTVGDRIIDMYHLADNYGYIQSMYREYDAWAVGVAGFTPIPYKVFTITAGAFRINFWIFILASAISRSARFFIVAWVLYRFGAGIRTFIDKYFNILSLVFAVLLVAGFVIIKILLR